MGVGSVLQTIGKRIRGELPREAVKCRNRQKKWEKAESGGQKEAPGEVSDKLSSGVGNVSGRGKAGGV